MIFGDVITRLLGFIDLARFFQVLRETFGAPGHGNFRPFQGSQVGLPGDTGKVDININDSTLYDIHAECI